MSDLTYTDRLDRLDAMLAEGRIIRGRWTSTDAHGRETACLLSALSPEAADAESAAACPSDVMPSWLAELTPDIDDLTTAAAWPGIVRRYGALAHRWHVLDAAAWRRAESRTWFEILAIAAPHDTEFVVEPVAALWRRVVAGDEPALEEWYAARAAARAAAWDAAEASVQDAAWDAARAAAKASVWDSIATACLDAIEAECEAAEAVHV